MGILSTLPAFVGYFVTATILTIVFFGIYIKATPYDEITLIKQGLIAPAISLAGAMMGFIVALSSVIKNSTSYLDMLIWGVVAMLVQLAAFIIVRLQFRSLTEGINNNNIAKAIFLAMTSLGFGLLNAACMTY